MSTSRPLRSVLLEGTVMHRRLVPFHHAFRYRLAMYRIDLDEVAALNARLHLFGVDRRRPVTFRPGDHLADIRRVVRAHGIETPVARVELVTSCRVFGYVFNPVSFFLCYAPTGCLAAIACEVNNTFGETHTYVLAADAAPGQWREKKVFHVSPFLSLDGTYRFRFSVSEQRLDVGIDLLRDGVPQFVSQLALQARPLTDGAVARALVRYPFVTAKIIAAIHWQAIRLWWKGATYHPKPAYDPESARHATES